MAHHLNFKRELDQVLFEGDGAVKKVILNRPKKFNSLTYDMVCQMLKKFRGFENDPTVAFVILKANGRAFCAGGDAVRHISTMASGHWSDGALFYGRQYNLDYLLGTYKKPLVALMDGIVMGGGAGISMNAKFKIVTENTVFAMPETSIGLFPDVGASYFLSRLPGFFGEYLGLTGARLDGSEMIACGLATHFVRSAELPQLEIALQAIRSADAEVIDDAINQFAQKSLIKNNSCFNKLNAINRSFSKDTVEEILVSIENEATSDHEDKSWITLALNSMKSASPLSLKIFLRSVREGRRQNLRECLIREYTIGCNIFRASASNDYFEGSRAMLFDKDKKPKWNPSKLELVSEDMVSLCFSGIDDDDWIYLQLPVRSTRVVAMKPSL